MTQNVYDDQGHRVNYHKDLLFRIVASLLAAHLMVTHGEPDGFFEVFFYPFYYVSMFFNFLIAYALIEFIYRITVWLDSKYAWEKRPLKRLILQVNYGLIGPGILAIVLAAFYYLLFSLNINNTRYFRSEFFVIILLLALLNCKYILQYIFIVFINAPDPEIINSRLPAHWPQIDFVMVYSFNHEKYVIDTSGIHHAWPYTLKDTIKSLPVTDYFMVNAWCIVKYDIIHSVLRPEINTENPVLSKKAIEPKLKRYYRLKLNIPFKRQIATSYRSASAFKLWWESKNRVIEDWPIGL